MKVVFCCPTVTRPYQQFLDAMYAEVPILDAAGIDHALVWEIGCPYISHARANMLRKALDTQPDAVVFLDHDLSWKPGDLLKLIQTPGDVVCGTYRFKQEDEKYMGNVVGDDDGKPIRRDDECILGNWVPAGFLKVTAQAVHDIMAAYPELMFGSRYRPHIDLFNHGAHEWIWYGEDYAFSRRWNDMGRQIWINGALSIDHHGADGTAYPGNLDASLSPKARHILSEAA
jgi:glycosyltransferase involved in cell wall biosynthesis